LGYLLVLKVNCIHLGKYLQLAFGRFLNQDYGKVEIVGDFLFPVEEIEREDLFPGDAFLRGIDSSIYWIPG